MILQDKTALAILAASILLRSIAASLIGPGFDESYYSVFARNLAWGYFDHPPFVAVTAGIGYWLTGVFNPFTLRLGAILLFTIALIGFYQVTIRLYGRKAAIFVLLLLHATPYFTFGAGAFVIPDNALIALWVWGLYIAMMLRDGSIRKTGGFVLLGLILGAALLAKYHAILLPASLVIVSIYDKKIRSWWTDWRLYLGLVVAIMVFYPCIYWNSQNEWVSFLEQFGKSTSGGFRIRFDLMGQAIGGQLGYLTPWIAILIWIKVFSKNRIQRDDRWLIAFFLTPVIGMTLIGLSRGILPHWTMPGYVAGCILAVGGMVDGIKTLRNLKIFIAINLILVFVLLVHANTGFIKIDPSSDPTLDPAGWGEVVEWLEDEGYLSENDVIWAHKWFAAGELSWSDQGKHDVVIIGTKPHNFAWWNPAPEYLGKSGYLITQERHKIAIEKDYIDKFESIEEIEVPVLKYKGRDIQMKVWKCENFLKTFQQPYGPYQISK